MIRKDEQQQENAPISLSNTVITFQNQTDFYKLVQLNINYYYTRNSYSPPLKHFSSAPGRRHQTLEDDVRFPDVDRTSDGDARACVTHATPLSQARPEQWKVAS